MAQVVPWLGMKDLFPLQCAKKRLCESPRVIKVVLQLLPHDVPQIHQGEAVQLAVWTKPWGLDRRLAARIPVVSTFTVQIIFVEDDVLLIGIDDSCRRPHTGDMNVFSCERTWGFFAARGQGRR